MPKKYAGFRLPPDCLSIIKEYSNKKGKTRPEILEEAIRLYDKLEKYEGTCKTKKEV